MSNKKKTIRLTINHRLSQTLTRSADSQFSRFQISRSLKLSFHDRQKINWCSLISWLIWQINSQRVINLVILLNSGAKFRLILGLQVSQSRLQWWCNYSLCGTSHTKTTHQVSWHLVLHSLIRNVTRERNTSFDKTKALSSNHCNGTLNPLGSRAAGTHVLSKISRKWLTGANCGLEMILLCSRERRTAALLSRLANFLLVALTE